MWIFELMRSVLFEIIPKILGLIITALIMRAEGGPMLHSATLALKIIIMLARARKGEVYDFSEIKQPEVKLQGKVIQLLDMTEAEIKIVNLNKGQIARVDAYKTKIEQFDCRDTVINIMDLSDSKIDVLDISRASINLLDAHRAEIKTLNMVDAHILNLDLSESTIHNIVGRDSAKVYIDVGWRAKIIRLTNKAKV